MITLLTTLILFGVIILGHELGHFLIANWVGIPAEEFSIGMGPKIYQRKTNKTLFSLRALPIGGYVKFVGEDEKSDDPRAFNNAKVWKRFLVILSGPLMNFFLAILLLTISFMSFGTVRTSTHILETIDASPAQEAGLQKGDKIIEINGRNLENMSEEKAIETIRDVIKSEGGQPLRLTILRDGEAKEFEMLPNYNTEKNTYEIGIYFGRLQRHGPLSSIKLAFIQTGRLIILMIQLVGSMIFKGQVLNEVVGPVGIVGEINKAVQSGIHDVINFAITITLNLGIINLIPFPALDGGRLALLVVEGLRGRPIDSQKEGYIHFVGFVLLMLLMIVVTFKDIVRQWF
ncbi:MAG: M50 family metallopeptidase [Caldicoprobacterales bacterium]|jgi:regulator of sigma E protease|nr:site-2 protease family protein [Clostridiales bacterium]